MAAITKTRPAPIGERMQESLAAVRRDRIAVALSTWRDYCDRAAGGDSLDEAQLQELSECCEVLNVEAADFDADCNALRTLNASGILREAEYQEQGVSLFNAVGSARARLTRARAEAAAADREVGACENRQRLHIMRSQEMNSLRARAVRLFGTTDQIMTAMGRPKPRPSTRVMGDEIVFEAPPRS